MTKQFCCQVYTSRNWKSTCTQKTCIWRFGAVWLMTTQKWKETRCSTTAEWINKIWSVHMMEYYSATEMKLWHALQSWWTLITLCSMKETNITDHILYYFVSIKCHWKDWCWNWSSNTLVTSCEELTHWKRPWFWEILTAGGEGVDRGWDGWTALLTRWTWVWTSSGSWWRTGKPVRLQSMGSQRVGHDWVTELNWTELDT